MPDPADGSHLTETFVFKERYHIEWVRIGDSESPPVVFVHGFPFSSLEWLPLAQALKKSYSVYLSDLPGFGASLDTGAMSLASHGEALAALCEHWGFSEKWRPHVVAHDVGGHAALRAHLVHGIRYASLCLLNILAVTPWGSPFLRAVMGNPEAFEAVPQAMFAGLMREYVQLAAYKTLTEARMAEFVGPWMGEEGQKRFLQQVRLFDQRDTEEMNAQYASVMSDFDLGGGRKKLKIIWAENDHLIPLSKGEALAEATGAAEFVKVPEAGHLVMIDQPEVVTYEILTWLGKVVK